MTRFIYIFVILNKIIKSTRNKKYIKNHLLKIEIKFR